MRNDRRLRDGKGIIKSSVNSYEFHFYFIFGVINLKKLLSKASKVFK